MSKITPKNEEEKLKLNVICYALNFTSSYDFLYPKDLLYGGFPYLWKSENYLVYLFHATDKLRDFLDCFPIPSQTNIRKIKDIESKKLFISVREKRKRLENSVLKKSISYYNNSKYPDEKESLFGVKAQFFDAILSYENYLDWEKRVRENLKKVQWIRNC